MSKLRGSPWPSQLLNLEACDGERPLPRNGHRLRPASGNKNNIAARVNVRLDDRAHTLEDSKLHVLQQDEEWMDGQARPTRDHEEFGLESTGEHAQSLRLAHRSYLLLQRKVQELQRTSSQLEWDASSREIVLEVARRLPVLIVPLTELIECGP